MVIITIITNDRVLLHASLDRAIIRKNRVALPIFNGKTQSSPPTPTTALLFPRDRRESYNRRGIGVGDTDGGISVSLRETDYDNWTSARRIKYEYWEEKRNGNCRNNVFTRGQFKFPSCFRSFSIQSCRIYVSDVLISTSQR